MVSVFDGDPAEDRRGVQRQAESSLRPELALSLGELEALLKEQALLLMEDQLRAKLLPRALGERLGVQSHAQRHLPAQIVGRPSRRLLVRAVVSSSETPS